MVKKLKRLKIPCLVVVITTVLVLCLGAVAASADASISGEFVCTSSTGDGEYSFYYSGFESNFPCTVYLTVSGLGSFELDFSATPQESGAEADVYYGYSGESVSITYSAVNEGFGDSFFTLTSDGFLGDTVSFTLDFDEPISSEDSPLDFILNLFVSLGQWFSTSLGSLISVFWLDGELTFLGMLAIVPLAFSVVFLIIGILQRFLHFGG